VHTIQQNGGDKILQNLRTHMPDYTIS